MRSLRILMYNYRVVFQLQRVLLVTCASSPRSCCIRGACIDCIKRIAPCVSRRGAIASASLSSGITARTVPAGRDGQSLVPTWTCVCPQAPWTPRFMAHAVVVPHEHVLLIGGMDGDGLLNDTWISHPCPRCSRRPSTETSACSSRVVCGSTGTSAASGSWTSGGSCPWMGAPPHHRAALGRRPACLRAWKTCWTGHSVFDVDSYGRRPSDVAASARVRDVLLQMESFPYSDA
jgi:hypothetical protein